MLVVFFSASRTPNAKPELLLKAGARYERTLEAVSSRPLLGGIPWIGRDERLV
jgi:hypothetical protein